MSEFIRISVYRTPTGLSMHVEHMLGAMPRPKVLRRRELSVGAAMGVPGWAAALGWAARELAKEARRLGDPPRSSGPTPPAPPLGGHGGEGSRPNPQP